MTIDITPEARAELAPSGRLVAAMNYGNAVLAQQDPATGEPRGVSADLARELARRLDVPVDFVAFDTAGKVAETATRGVWTIAFLAIDPRRAETIDFTPAYVLIEGTYVVPAASPLVRMEDVDRDGVRLAVGAGSAYDLYLTRAIGRATLVRAPTSRAALDMFVADGLEAAAGVREAVAAFAAARPDLRMIDEPFMTIRQAMAIPKGRTAGAACLRAFIEEMKGSGFVAASLLASGQRDARVAPPE